MQKETYIYMISMHRWSDDVEELVNIKFISNRSGPLQLLGYGSSKSKSTYKQISYNPMHRGRSGVEHSLRRWLRVWKQCGVTNILDWWVDFCWADTRCSSLFGSWAAPKLARASSLENCNEPSRVVYKSSDRVGKLRAFHRALSLHEWFTR
jgi:hypothetical protein